MRKFRKNGFTIIEIMIVVSIIGLLAAKAVPSYMNARATSDKNTCMANLKQLDSAIVNYYMDTGAWPGQLSDLYPYYLFRMETECPSGDASYVYNPPAGGDPPYTSCPNHGNVAGK